MQSDSCQLGNSCVLGDYSITCRMSCTCFRQICCWRPTVTFIGWGAAGRKLVFQLYSGCWCWWFMERSNVGLHLESSEYTGRRIQKGKRAKQKWQTQLTIYGVESHWVILDLILAIIKVIPHPYPSVPKEQWRLGWWIYPKDAQWMVGLRLELGTTDSHCCALSIIPLSCVSR